MHFRTTFLVALTLALSAVAGLLVAVGGQGPVAAAPLPAPTPVSVTMGADPSSPVTFFDGRALTAAVGSPAQNVADHDKVDLQWIVDQGAPTNAVTLTLQFSNDGVNWVDGPAVAGNVTADANDMQQFAVFGRWARVLPALAGSDPVTVTVIGVAK